HYRDRNGRRRLDVHRRYRAHDHPTHRRLGARPGTRSERRRRTHRAPDHADHLPSPVRLDPTDVRQRCTDQWRGGLMYAWVWRHLPGPWPVRAFIALVLVAAIVVVLFRWGFPWLEQTFGLNDVTVG